MFDSLPNWDIEEFESPKKKKDVEESLRQTSTTTSTPSDIEDEESSAESQFTIEEFESPKKRKDSEDRLTVQQNTEQFLEEWTVVKGKRRKRLCLGAQLKAIAEDYDSSVRRFAQDYRLNKFDEEQSMTLVIRYICGKDERLVWTVSRHVEDGVDRCVMFKPLYMSEIRVGVVLKLYQPWKLLDLPGVPLPVIFCSDFYRIGQKRDNYFGVSEEQRNELITGLVPFKSSYIKIAIDDAFRSTLISLVPYNLKNMNTLTHQTKLSKAAIDLDAVIHHLQLPSVCQTPRICTNIILLCDSDNKLAILQLPVTASSKKESLLLILKSGQFIKFKSLGIVSKTTITEDNRLFEILRSLESNQVIYYTVNVRHDTTWEVQLNLEIPYHPFILTTCPMHKKEDTEISLDS